MDYPVRIVVFQESLLRHRKLYLFEGGLLIVMGVAAILLPAITALAFNLIVAVTLILAGIGRLTTWSRRTSDRLWKLLGGLLLLLTGLLMAIYPEAGLTALILVLGVMLLLEGVLTIVIARYYRHFPPANWLLASGILSLVLGVVILILFPVAGIVYLSLMLGLSLIMSGVSILLLVWSAVKRKADERSPS